MLAACSLCSVSARRAMYVYNNDGTRITPMPLHAYTLYDARQNVPLLFFYGWVLRPRRCRRLLLFPTNSPSWSLLCPALLCSFYAHVYFPYLQCRFVYVRRVPVGYDSVLVCTLRLFVPVTAFGGYMATTPTSPAILPASTISGLSVSVFNVSRLAAACDG